jgi:hypothetical protein
MLMLTCRPVFTDEALERMAAYVATGQKSQGQIIEEQKQELERQLKEQQD